MWAGLALISCNVGVALTQLAVLRSSLLIPPLMLPLFLSLSHAEVERPIVFLLVDIYAAIAGGRRENKKKGILGLSEHPRFWSWDNIRAHSWFYRW